MYDERQCVSCGDWTRDCNCWKCPRCTATRPGDDDGCHCGYHIFDDYDNPDEPDEPDEPVESVENFSDEELSLYAARGVQELSDFLKAWYS
jgi:hypothetical protein